MGRKGTNKSKSKKNKSSKGNSANLPSKGNPPGQVLVKNNEATHNKDGSVLNGWEKRNKKGKLTP